MPKQREKMTEVHSCGSPPFSTCLGAVASFIISQGQKCHKKPFPLVYHQSHKEKSVKGGHRPQRLPLILFFVGYNAGGENGCQSVPLLPPVLHCPFRRKKVKGGLRPLKDRLKENITSIHTMIDSMSEEELFQPHMRKWADDATKAAVWEVYKFIHVNTVAPFGTFRTKIRKWKKIAL